MSNNDTCLLSRNLEIKKKELTKLEKYTHFQGF